ncbi:MAG: TolC family protein [Candidatus Poribacteria bacterium]|nr:TolC family protein [Candidatus Poribacteria bacterium]
MKTTPSRILIMVSMYLFILSTVKIPTAFSEGEDKIALDTAIQTALRDNPELSAIRERLKVARARIDGIALLGNPELETEFVGGIDGDQVFELSKPFELGGQHGHRKRIANILLEKVNAELADASRLLTTSVKLGFYDLALVQEKLKLTEAVIQHYERMRNIAQVQFETGDISVTQLNLARVQLQAALRGAAALEGELQLAQLEINNLMGASLEAVPIAVVSLSEKMPLNQLQSLTLDALTARALANRGDLKSLRLNAQLTDRVLRLAKSAKIPDLNIAGIAQRSPNKRAFGVKFSFPLPVFDRNRAKIDVVKAEQGVNAIEISNKERQITREVMGAFISLKAAQKKLKFYEGDMLDLLNENLKLTRAAYELGQTGILEVILIQNEFIKIRFAHLDALAAFHKALIELEAAIGISVEMFQQSNSIGG